MVELTCPLCLEVLSTTTNYRTGCCGAYLCWDCFDHLNSNQSATCEQCHNTVEPFQVDAALAQLIHKAVSEAISDITVQLDLTQHDLRLIQANLTALQANLVSLYQEIDDSDHFDDLNSRRHQLTSLAHSQTKAYQLILDRLTTREQLLLSRLDYLTHITAKSAEILTLLAQWRQSSASPDGNATTDPVIETYQPRVWWRCRQGCPKSFQTTWLVVPLAVNSAGQVVPRINHLVSKTRQSLTRLLVPPGQPPGKSQASVIMIRQQDIMLAQGRALILSSGDNPVWRINDDPEAPLDLNLSLGLVPSGQAIRGCSIGLLPQGYYISYQRELVKSGWFGQTSTEVIMTLLNYDLGVNPDQSAVQASRSWTITLPAVASQQYQYDDKWLFVVMTGIEGWSQLSLINLTLQPAQIVLTLPHRDVKMTRFEQDQIYLTSSQGRVWRYDISAVIAVADEPTTSWTATKAVAKGLVAAQLARELAANLIYPHYSETAAPGITVYCNMAQHILATVNGVIYQANFESVILADNGTICLL